MNFAIQIVAAHLLGARGLGQVALCLGVIVLGGAVTSGVVGDSLTVLDRHDTRIRGALLWWAVMLIGTTSAVAAAALHYAVGLSARDAVFFAAASVSFQTAEVMRRVFMATLRFWYLIVVDTVALLASLASLVVLVAERRVAVGTFLVAIAVGQTMACLAAYSLLPKHDRALVLPRRGARRAVAAFGLWRGAQVAINPAVLTAARFLVVFAAGSAALGELEAARIFVAPAILIVQGLGSYLLASYARDRDVPLASLVSRATSAALGMGGATVAAGLLLALAAPTAGHLVSGPSFHVANLAVLGWGAYAASLATLQPFASLAAARGRPRAVLAVRCADAAVSTGVLLALLLPLGLPPEAAPFALATGPVLGGLLTRHVVLRPMLRSQRGSGHPSTPIRSTSAMPAETGYEHDRSKAVHHDL